MKKIIYIDMDNVLVDFSSAITKIDKTVLDQCQGKYDEIEGIFSLMTPMPMAIEAIEFLNDNFDVFILSTPPWNNPSAWSDKLNWVKQFMPVVGYKRLILSHNKHLNHGDYLIDDRLKNGVDKFVGFHIHYGHGIFDSWANVIVFLCDIEKIDCQKIWTDRI